MAFCISSTARTHSRAVALADAGGGCRWSGMFGKLYEALYLINSIERAPPHLADNRLTPVVGAGSVAQATEARLGLPGSKSRLPP